MEPSKPSSADPRTIYTSQAAHVLKKANGDYSPSLCVFVDCEANLSPWQGRPRRQVHTFRLGVASAVWLKSGRQVAREVLRFTRPEQFWTWLQSVRLRDRQTWVFSHNLGYDLTLLGFWDMLVQGPQRLRFVVIEDPPTIIVTQWGRRCVTYVDTLNYWQLPLKDLGMSVSLPKLPIPDQSAARPDWFAYCQRDVEIIERCLTQTIFLARERNLCSWKPTAAGLSWHAYRKCFSGTPIYIHSCSKAKRLERDGFYGGRVWCPSQGKVDEPVAIVDVNSLYPWVMATQRLPNKLLTYTECVSRQELRRMLTESLGIAHVILSAPHMPLPLRTRQGLDFTTGCCETVLCGAELAAAYAAGAVRAVYRAALYSVGDLFSGFVNTLYESKQRAVAAGNPADAAFFKLILNSLSGKWAQRRRVWVDDPKQPIPADYAFWYVCSSERRTPIRYRALARKCQFLDDGGEPRDSFPAISAAISAHARTLLERLVCAVPHGAALYADTDSVHTLLPGLATLAGSGFEFSSRLGGLREVYRGTNATYWGPRHYRVGERFCCLGVKPSAVEVSDGVYRQDAFSGISETLQSGALQEVVVAERTVKHREATETARRLVYGA